MKRMSTMIPKVVLCVLFMINLAFATKKTVDDYMNICLDANFHKTVPGPESKLAYQCSPWKSRSCCTQKTAANMHKTRRWLNFDWNHCKELSPRCREYFMQDTCFYECSPNVGPWIVKDVRKIRNERFKGVPLCQSECDNWWNSCKDDLTCVERWDKHFNWSTGLNTCPTGTTCKPFHELYDGSNHFCESVFGSFNVTNSTDCFYLWFDPKYPNPNEKVARKKAAAILGLPIDHASQYVVSLLALVSCISIAFIFGQY